MVGGRFLCVRISGGGVRVLLFSFFDVRVYVCLCVCVYLGVYMCVCVCVLVCVCVGFYIVVGGSCWGTRFIVKISWFKGNSVVFSYVVIWGWGM